MEAKYVIAMFFVVIVSSTGAYATDLPTPVDGLSWTFYNETCPNLESIVNTTLEAALDEDITQAAGLLRLHFHDCFVQVWIGLGRLSLIERWFAYVVI